MSMGRRVEPGDDGGDAEVGKYPRCGDTFAASLVLAG
jgi:hypothetical protein